MARMSENDECTSRNFGYSAQFTNQILDSGETCHMTPEVPDFIPVLLDNMAKHIEFSGRNHITAKQRGQL